MHTDMAFPILFLVVLLITTLPLPTHCNKGFSVDLLHRDSPDSPYHNPSLSKPDRLRAAARRSIARADHFRLYPTVAAVADAGNSPSLQSPLTSSHFEYLMTVSIGTPPFKIHAIADTGSDLVWTDCKPCLSCYNQTDPLFDPDGSSTYRTTSCGAGTCSAFPQGSCNGNSLCGYHYSYGDGSFTDGVLSSETFTFDSVGGGTVSVPQVSFGCSHRSNGTFDKSDGGLVGLGGGPLSLVSQLGSSIDNKFSYCLVPYFNYSSPSLINFGDRAVVGPNAVTTPIIRRDGPESTFYYLSLEDVTVSNKTITAGDKLSSPDGNIIIDSGTTLTLLDEAMVKPLVDTLSQVVKYPQVNDPGNIFSFCIDVSNSLEIELPDMTFRFSGAPVTLSPFSTFVEVDDGVLCLAIVSTGVGGIRIFGNIAQQNLHIGYDLGARMLSIAPADCTKL